MNYYPHHIGDYLRDTAHLTALEDGTYRRLLDVYYASEKPLPLETHWVCRLVRARTQEEQDAVHEVLRQFFDKRPDGWHNKRADHEIKVAARKAKVARQNGKLGGRPKTQRVSSGLAKPNLTGNPDESSQNQNQKPKPKAKERAERGTRLPSDWVPSELLKAWAQQKRPDLDFDTTVERFRNHWTAKAGKDAVKLDWEATFRNWVLGERQQTSRAAPDYSAVIANLKD